ncbi:hypothetical protein AFLA_006495 [Aspergillus flavus NRRL3357]|nr:hypothetical protein AFLA_006495 [Aspergillus flavus NRRL3357]
MVSTRTDHLPIVTWTSARKIEDDIKVQISPDNLDPRTTTKDRQEHHQLSSGASRTNSFIHSLYTPLFVTKEAYIASITTIIYSSSSRPGPGPVPITTLSKGFWLHENALFRPHCSLYRRRLLNSGTIFAKTICDQLAVALVDDFLSIAFAISTNIRMADLYGVTSVYLSRNNWLIISSVYLLVNNVGFRCCDGIASYRFCPHIPINSLGPFLTYLES